MSAVIGTGIFSHDGLALSVAGPAGLVLATCVVGLIAVAFMDGLSEMIQCFPCSNALIEYVDAFVDPELSVCVGFAYFAVWSIFFSLQLGAAADFCSVWSLQMPDLDIALRVVLFFIAMPFLLFYINTRDVSLFGWIETFGGFFKLIVITGMSFILYYLAGLNEGLQAHVETRSDEPLRSTGTYLDDGFTGSEAYPHPLANAFAVLPIAAFAWVGIEIVAVTAFEAVTLEDLKLPSQRLPYVTFLVYLVCAIGSGMSVKFNNSALAQIFSVDANSKTQSGPPLEFESPVSSSSSLIIIAANQVGSFPMAHVFNGFLIFSALSAGNTCLYVASRTLYGLAFNLKGQPHRSRYFQWVIDKIATVKESNKVPVNAVRVSAIAFCWLPFLSLRDIPTTNQDYTHGPRKVDAASQQFLNTAASLMALFVWGCECLAFIRYWHWMKKYSGEEGLLEQSFPHLNRFKRAEGGQKRQGIASTLLGRFQPVPAYFGAFGCFAIVFVLPTALIWDNKPIGPHASSSLAYQMLEIYIAPGLILALWLALKINKLYIKRYTDATWFVPMTEDGLEDALKKLARLSEEPASRASSWEMAAMQPTQPIHPGTPLSSQPPEYGTPVS